MRFGLRKGGLSGTQAQDALHEVTTQPSAGQWALHLPGLLSCPTTGDRDHRTETAARDGTILPGPPGKLLPTPRPHQAPWALPPTTTLPRPLGKPPGSLLGALPPAPTASGGLLSRQFTPSSWNGSQRRPLLPQGAEHGFQAYLGDTSPRLRQTSGHTGRTVRTAGGSASPPPEDRAQGFCGRCGVRGRAQCGLGAETWGVTGSQVGG